MALYVALCYYDRDQPWDGVPRCALAWTPPTLWPRC